MNWLKIEKKKEEGSWKSEDGSQQQANGKLSTVFCASLIKSN
jgi:hypothetical protein